MGLHPAARCQHGDDWQRHGRQGYGPRRHGCDDGMLFVGGVMNVLWIAGITIMALLEKIIPARRLIPRVAGLACITAGVWLLATAPG